MLNRLDTLEANKTVVHAFYDLAFNRKMPEEAVKRYVGASYRQHNPSAADGADAFIEFVTGFTQSFMALKVNFRRMVAEGDLAVVHSHLVPTPGERRMAVMDIFRLEEGKVVEHWDVLQEIPEKPANNNTMF